MLDVPGETKDDKRILVKFLPSGPIGVFNTNDKSLIKKLKAHAKFNFNGPGSFQSTAPAGSKQKVGVRKGTRGSITEPKQQPIKKMETIPGVDD